MATDISISIEKLEDSGWVYVGGDDDVLDDGGRFLKRNYALYGILANTKDDYKIIDQHTTIGYIPIVEPRGIPDDADKDQEYSSRSFVKDPYNRWYPSWVTLEEIMQYPHWETKEKDGEIYAESCKEFLNEFVPKLSQLVNDPKRLRLVYSFW